MRLVAGVFLTVVTVAWSTVCYAWVEERQRRTRSACIAALAAQRRRYDRELHELRTLLLEHLGLDVPDGWPETEPDPIDDTPTGPIARAWDEAAAELVAAEPRTVERTVNGFTFRFREDAA